MIIDLIWGPRLEKDETYNVIYMYIYIYQRIKNIVKNKASMMMMF